MKKALGIFLALALGLLSACAAEKSVSDGGVRIDVYRVVKQDYRDGGELIRAEALVSGDLETETLVRGAAYALMSLPGSEELSPALPGDVRIENVLLSGQTVNVVMSDTYRELGGMDRTLAQACVTLTMCSIPGVNFVSMKTQEEPGAKVMSAEDILLKNTMVSDSQLELRLYFPKAGEDILAAEYRQITLDEDMPIERRIIDELIAGPKNQALEAILPEDTAVLSVYTHDGLCSVSLSEGFMDGEQYDSTDVRLAAYSIVNSLTCLSYVDRVQINVRNNEAQMIGDLDISQTFSRRSTIIGSAPIAQQ